MALVECAECGREISDKAAACLGCGNPVTASVPSMTQPIEAARWRVGRIFGWGSLLTSLAFAALAVVDSPAIRRNEQAIGNEYYLLHLCSKRLRENINDRESLDTIQIVHKQCADHQNRLEELQIERSLLAPWSKWF